MQEHYIIRIQLLDEDRHYPTYTHTIRLQETQRKTNLRIIRLAICISIIIVHTYTLELETHLHHITPLHICIYKPCNIKDSTNYTHITPTSYINYICSESFIDRTESQKPRNRC